MHFNNLKGKILDKWFYFPIVLLAIIFIIRILDMSKMIWIFPFDKNMDLVAYISLFFILTKYSFHQFVPIWCNGFILFQNYYPAWFYFTLPFYYFTKNIGLIIFLSFIWIYLLIFILIYVLGRLQNISKIKRIAFFLFLVANPIFLGYILRVGRIIELFSWMIFILFFILIIRYKNKFLDKYFLIFIPIYSLLLLSHYSAFIVSTSFIMSLFLVRRKLKEIIYIMFSIFSFLIITAFWWIPFIKNINNTSAGTYFSLKWIISSTPGTIMDKISTILIPIIFLIVFYIYWRNKSKDKKEFLFFLPQILFAVLLLFRILPFIPIYNRVTPDTYNILFIFLSLFLFFKTKFTKRLSKWIIVLLFILPVISILITSIFTPAYRLHSNEDEDIINLLKDIDDRLFIYAPEERESYVYYGYATIYYNLSTPMAGTPTVLTIDLMKKDNLAIAYLDKGDCFNLLKLFKELNVKNIIATKEKCRKLRKCSFNLKNQNENACLFNLKWN